MGENNTPTALKGCGVKTSEAEKVKSSKRARRSKAAVPHSSPIQQQRDAGIGCASNENPPPDKFMQEALHIGGAG